MNLPYRLNRKNDQYIFFYLHRYTQPILARLRERFAPNVRGFNYSPHKGDTALPQKGAGLESLQPLIIT